MGSAITCVYRCPSIHFVISRALLVQTKVSSFGSLCRCNCALDRHYSSIFCTEQGVFIQITFMLQLCPRSCLSDRGNPNSNCQQKKKKKKKKSTLVDTTA